MLTINDDDVHAANPSQVPAADAYPASPDGPIQVTRELECELNDAEIQERGEAMAHDERECDRLKDRRKALNAQIRGKLDHMTVLAKAIESRKEVRDVPCTWRPDYQRSVWELMRDDRGTVVDHRPMTKADRQVRLPLASAAEAEAAGTGDNAGDEYDDADSGDGDDIDDIDERGDDDDDDDGNGSLEYADGTMHLLPARHPLDARHPNGLTENEHADAERASKPRAPRAPRAKPAPTASKRKPKARAATNGKRGR